MKVKDLIVKLENLDPEAEVIIAGFETTGSSWVAGADLIIPCVSNVAHSAVNGQTDPMLGNRKISGIGDKSVWIGWKADYRTESFMDIIADPENNTYE